MEWERLEISSRKLEIQGNISCKDGHNKGQKCMDLTETEDSKKRCQEYTEELCKKCLYDSENHYGAITQLEPVSSWMMNKLTL